LSFRIILALVIITAAVRVARAQDDDPVITLRRTSCFGTCPVYSLEIFEDGFIRYVGTQFVQVRGERRAVIPRDAVDDLVSHFLQLDYFALQDSYETYTAPDGSVWHVTDLPTTYSSLHVGKRKKSVTDYAFAPKALAEIELEVDRVANTHRWIDGEADDLKRWEFVQPDVYRRIKPGMNRLMQAAGEGDLKELAREHDAGTNIDAADETGWTALMLASALCQQQSVRTLLDWGAKVDLRDKRGDTALIGASAAFCTTEKAREGQVNIVKMLIQRGANPDTQDSAGETALMAVTTYGNVSALRALLELGAQTDIKDGHGRSAMDFARTALNQSRDRFWTTELRELATILEARQ
jgi:hypothetical protein